MTKLGIAVAGAGFIGPVRLPTAAIRFVLSLLLANIAAAEEPAGYRMRLFNGRNLDGWIVTGCEAEVQDGLLVLKDGNGLLRSQHRYADFVLELQWRTRRDKDWDSGVFIRAELPPEGQSWPERYQVNLRQGLEGNLVGRPETGGKDLVVAGHWNHFKLIVVGAEAALEINGKPAWKVSGIEPRDGYIGLQAEVPGGGQFEFKDIVITEVGYRSLFNGTDLSGWEGGGGDAASCWKAEEETLVCTGRPGTWLRSKEKFGDFNLRLEYKLRPGGNSGVYIRVPSDGNHHGAEAGIEVQILDDTSERYKNLQPYQFSASLYAILAAEPRVGRPPGEWNTLEINCCGRSYRVIHNGIQVVKADEHTTPELKQRLVEGFLGLQNHSEEVWFRHLRLGPPE
jgi:Domain of Unknown Function (DUF1080)